MSPKAVPPADSVQAAIQQTKPFRSISEEAVIGLLLAAESVRWPHQDFLQDHGITLPQYNVLRILRGSGAAGLPTLEIAARMVERTPGITRMLDRMEAKGLVARERSPQDRRRVLCRLTDAGTQLVRKLDRPTDSVNRASMGGLSEREQRQLIRLLNRVRSDATPPASR